MSNSTVQFLRTVVTAPDDNTWLCVACANRAKQSWREYWYKWPTQAEDAADFATRASTANDVYFSAYTFRDKSSTKTNAIAYRTIQADLDEADVLSLPMQPSVLVQTSPGRHQGYWLLRLPSDSPETHEAISRRLTYAISRCDPSGWSIGHKVRLPGTVNHKYAEQPEVKVVDISSRRYNAYEFDRLPEPSQTKLDILGAGLDWINDIEVDAGPLQMLRELRSKLGSRVTHQYHITAKDRSAALWALELALFRAGLDRGKVFYLAKHSANNKFADLKHGADEALAKDVLRAEASVKGTDIDVRDRVEQLRRLPLSAHERQTIVSKIVKESLEETGEFVHCNDGTLWYTRSDIGRPVSLAKRSDHLDSLLEYQFGLNSTEEEQKYTVAALLTSVREMPPAGLIASLTYYDQDTNVLYLHTGRRDVLRITATSIERILNGSYGVVFPWDSSMDQFDPNMSYDGSWSDILFGQTLNNLVGLSSSSALTLLRVWLLFLLLRDAAASRPILAFLGQPGAGKSTMFRRIYALLYGPRKGIGAVTKSDDFDTAVATNPLVVLDNADTWERWLPDRLALSAGTSEIVKRKLYTDVDTITLRRQALIGITAHTPRFAREDVNDRLLLLTFERLQHFVPESEILNRIVSGRGDLWGGIIKDLQRVLQTPMPRERDLVQFRIEDFARLGTWIATALGEVEEFKSAIDAVRNDQKIFTLEEEQLLVDALRQFMARSKDPGAWRTPSQLWTALEAYTADQPGFVKRYRNPMVLGRKLWSLQDSLRTTLNVDWQFDTKTTTRLWRFGGGETAQVGAHKDERGTTSASGG